MSLTYATVSFLFWYLGLVPDLATLRDRAATRTRQEAPGASGAVFGVMDGDAGSGVYFTDGTAAGTVLATIPMIIIFFFFQKQFVGGISLSGLKD
jgi:ABC-type glycerol-3-phosphate transport system permease component